MHSFAIVRQLLAYFRVKPKSYSKPEIKSNSDAFTAKELSSEVVFTGYPYLN